MSIEIEQFEKVMAELRRACLPAGGADAVQAYVDSLAGALAQMEAERDTAIVQMQNIRKQRDAINKKLGDAEFTLCVAQQQLAEAVGLLREFRAKRMNVPISLCEQTDRFLARHAQAEQPEARPAGTSEVTAEDPRTASQSAMSADDEHEAFSAWAHEKGFCLDCAFFEEGNNFENSDTRLAYEIWMARAALATQPAAKEGVVCVEVSGLTGTGKTAVAGEIEVAMLALGLEVQWVEGDREKRLNHADFAGELELYKPRIEIRERNIARPAVRGAEHE